ncbi:MAG: hypothetical protein ACYDBW_06465 [Sulfuricaulis sp.]
MPHYLTKTFALIFAVSAALTCGIAIASTVTGETVAPVGNTQTIAPAGSSRPILMFLPDAAMGASQKPFSRFQSEQTSDAVNHKETKNSAPSPTPALFLNHETRPMRSLIIGWLPAKEGTNTNGLYQPGQYQYASTPTETGCRTVDRTANNAVEIPDGGGKSLHLPAGWLLGMCLHY